MCFLPEMEQRIYCGREIDFLLFQVSFAVGHGALVMLRGAAGAAAARAVARAAAATAARAAAAASDALMKRRAQATSRCIPLPSPPIQEQWMRVGKQYFFRTTFHFTSESDHAYPCSPGPAPALPRHCPSLRDPRGDAMRCLALPGLAWLSLWPDRTSPGLPLAFPWPSLGAAAGTAPCPSPPLPPLSTVNITPFSAHKSSSSHQ